MTVQKPKVQVVKRSVKAAVKALPLVQERRDRLIRAAVTVFKEKGFAATTIRDIGRQADLTQGTIYNYVRSKEDILYLVCDRLVTEYQDKIRDAIEHRPDPVERIELAARAICDVIYEHQDELLVIYQNTHLLDGRSLKVILTRVDGFIHFFQDLLTEAGREAGVPIEQPYVAANVLTYLPTIIALRRWAFESEVDQKDLLEFISRFLVTGLGFAARCHPGSR